MCFNLCVFSSSPPNELNRLLGLAIDSAGEVTSIQRRLELSLAEKERLVSEGKLVQSKVLRLHELLRQTCPRYSQLLADHPLLGSYLQQIERSPNEGTEGDSANAAMGHRTRCRNSSKSGRQTRRRGRVHLKQQAPMQRLSPEGLLLPSAAIKQQLATSKGSSNSTA